MLLDHQLNFAVVVSKLNHLDLLKPPFYFIHNRHFYCTQNPTEDQNKIIQLENEKHDYQIHAKDSLRAICLEKSDVGRKCADLENLLTTARIEVSHHKNLHDSTQAELIKGLKFVLLYFHQ